MRINSYPSIIIFKEQYVERFFVVNSIEDAAKVCHKVLLDNDQIGYYPTAEDVSKRAAEGRERAYSWLGDSARAFVDLTDDEVQSLPEALRKNALDVRAAYTKKLSRENAYMNQDMRFVESLAKIKSMGEEGWSLKDEKGNYVCINMIDERSNGEYEGYDVEESESY